MNNEEENFLNVNWKFLFLHIIVVRDLLDNRLYDLYEMDNNFPVTHTVRSTFLPEHNLSKHIKKN